MNIFSHLNKRDLCKCSLVCKRWNSLSYMDCLWAEFSLTDIVKPKWCASRLISMQNTKFLICKRFSQTILRVDLAKLCFSFETLNTLFQNCNFIKSLVINFKYLQIKTPSHYMIEQCIHTWPINRLEKLYLKNVCDMKTRRYCRSNHSTQPPTAYDIIEIEIIKLIKTLLNRNTLSLKVLGFKCVDPNIISSCKNDIAGIKILLLNNINDTDSVLSDIAGVCTKLKSLELTKCKEFHGDGLQEFIENTKLETLQLGKYIYPTFDELKEINFSNLKSHLRELSISTKFVLNDAAGNQQLSPTSRPTESIDLYSKTLFNYLHDNQLEYLALEDFTLKFPQNENIYPIYKVTKANSKFNETFEPRSKRIRSGDCQNVCSEANTNLKYLALRNIRNVKLSACQSISLKFFLQLQYNLRTLDLIGLYLSSDFICSILVHLKNLKYNF